MLLKLWSIFKWLFLLCISIYLLYVGMSTFDQQYQQFRYDEIPSSVIEKV